MPLATHSPVRRKRLTYHLVRRAAAGIVKACFVEWVCLRLILGDS